MRGLQLRGTRAPLSLGGEGIVTKRYWIARVDVHDPEGYKAYLTANAAALKKYGARFLVRGGRFHCPEVGIAPATS